MWVQSNTFVAQYFHGTFYCMKDLETADQKTSLQSLLNEIKENRLSEGKPFAAALADALAAPPPVDLIEAFSGDEPMEADDFRRLIARMARPAAHETTLEAGAKTTARQFASGDPDATRLVRDTLDGKPVQQVQAEVKNTNTIEIVKRLEVSLMRLGMPQLNNESLALPSPNQGDISPAGIEAISQDKK